MSKKGYLLDTNICAFFLRGKYDVDQAIDRVGWNNCFISEITVFELKIGAELSQQRDGINRSAQLDRFLYSISILPMTDAIDLAAKEKIRLRMAGTPVDDNFDLLIGCTAIVNDLVMVTENTKDFRNFQNIQLENWITR
ncbi:MAG: PIN domain-containing protein [Bacteroidales bacterium]|nr:PIN domain-containing protein [Bacteroidales bacterium]